MRAHLSIGSLIGYKYYLCPIWLAYKGFYITTLTLLGQYNQHVIQVRSEILCYPSIRHAEAQNHKSQIRIVMINARYHLTGYI